MRCFVQQAVFRVALAASVLIGPEVLPPQSRPGDPRAVLQVESRNEPFRSNFQYLLDDSQPSRWQSGWQLAEDSGSSVAALLSDLWAEEDSRLERRLLLQAAQSLAAGPMRDVPMALSRLDDQEKVMALLIVATGPRRTDADGDLPRLTDRREKMIVRVAAYLALSRQPGGVPPIRAQDDRDDPGLLSAALYAGLGLPERERRDLTLQTTGPRHLIWRGYLLADLQPDPDRTRRLERAEEIVRSPKYALSSSPRIREVRRAAALGLARLGDPDVVRSILPDPDPQLVLLLAAESRMRAGLPLEPVPGSLLDPPARRRLAVLYAVETPPETVLAAAEAWTDDAEIRGPMCLALAFSLLGRTDPVSVPDRVAALPEGAWVLWASGAEPEARTAPSLPPALARALSLALADRLPAATARRILEDELWRTGSHPGLPRVEAELALIRDLLLSGSIHVSAALGIEAQDRYLPGGVARTDNKFFEIAYQFVQFAGIPRQIPAALRLR